jgi:hypothetical protein
MGRHLMPESKAQLAVERRRNKVLLEITLEDDYAAMQMYDQITDSAAKIGEVTIVLELEAE